MSRRDSSKIEENIKNKTEAGEGTPLKVIQNLNSEEVCKAPLKINNARLNDLRSIDSSSEEELGVRKITIEADSQIR